MLILMMLKSGILLNMPSLARDRSDIVLDAPRPEVTEHGNVDRLMMSASPFG